MIEFLQLFLLGMATGGFYTINALGVVVVFRSSGIINFTASGLAMVGGYVEWDLADSHGLPHVVAVLGAVLVSSAVGLLVYVLAIRPLSAASTLAKVIATLALFVSFQQAVILIFGGLPKVPTSYLPQSPVSIGSVHVGADSLTILLFSIVLTMALWLLYRRSSFGAGNLRAV